MSDWLQGYDAVIFGGLGTLADCAELDLAAWNAAFRIHGLDWFWSWETYASLTHEVGHRHLAAAYAALHGEDHRADALDATHQKIFAAKLAQNIHLRSGVRDVLRAAAHGGRGLGFVSRSDLMPVRALLGATARAREGISFDAVILRGDVTRHAPHPEAMQSCIRALEVPANKVLVIVDRGAAAYAAQDAGCHVVGFPSRLAEEGEFPADLPLLHILDITKLVRPAPDGRGQHAAE